MLDKNNKASVYERSYESSIIAPSEKLLFLCQISWKFYLSWAFAFERTRAKRVPFLFLILLLGFGACPNKAQS